MKRVQLWRFVSEQPAYDIGERFMRRIEYQPIGITAWSYKQRRTHDAPSAPLLIDYIPTHNFTP
jgi:hypothetical protein